MKRLFGKRAYRPAVIGRWFYAALAEAAIRPAYGW